VAEARDRLVDRMRDAEAAAERRRRSRGLAVSVRIVRLGSPRLRGEGLRIGTVRRPPRGVPKREHAEKNWYDVWLPELAPSAQAVKLGLAARTARQWQAFVGRYRREMAARDKVRILELLAALSHQANFSVGCYCAEESRCHRSVLRALLEDRGAEIE
jgi:uncharacterized protein YeaO (DUF488 family)